MIAYYQGHDYLTIRNKVIILMLIDTGIRLSELTGLTEEQIKYLRENGHGELLDNYFKHLEHYKKVKRFENWFNRYAAAGCLTFGCFIPSLIIFILVIVGVWRMIFGD
ncbi:MAG: hypothetical protein IJ955_06235 [Oscillospiraceae bacterium]|nr:hypothetical protein [Oscillospiraceae bacterium]